MGVIFLATLGLLVFYFFKLKLYQGLAGKKGKADQTAEEPTEESDEEENVEDILKKTEEKVEEKTEENNE